jgi:glc operon protein GlcG
MKSSLIASTTLALLAAGSAQAQPTAQAQPVAQAQAAAPAQAGLPAATPVMADAPVATYGAPISLDLARRVAAAAQAEAAHEGVKAAIAIVDPSGGLVWFERIDDTQTGSIDLAQRKAVTAAIYRRDTLEYLRSLRSGNLGVLTLGVVATPGGTPLVSNGHVVGAIGVSGGVGMQDSQIAGAGSAAIH